MARRHRRSEITFAEMDRRPSTYGGRAGRGVEVSGDAAAQLSTMIRSDPNDPRPGVKKR